MIWILEVWVAASVATVLLWEAVKRWVGSRH